MRLQQVTDDPQIRHGETPTSSPKDFAYEGHSPKVNGGAAFVRHVGERCNCLHPRVCRGRSPILAQRVAQGRPLLLLTGVSQPLSGFTIT